jgi:hypothetical protein
MSKLDLTPDEEKELLAILERYRTTCESRLRIPTIGNSESSSGKEKNS